MDLQFQKTPVVCLKQAVCDQNVREYTQELRIPDGFADVGSVICAWGQVLVRGKQWDSEKIGCSGGIQVWVLYTPEDGSTPTVVESWIPFEQSWDLPNPTGDGRIFIIPALHQVDARVISPKKLMLKAILGMRCRAYVSTQAEFSSPGAMPEDVQLLVREYSALIPTEAGERAFSVDEELPIPEDMPQPEKLIYCTLSPLINEIKVMAGKLIFRGTGRVHMVYMTDGRLHTYNWQLPIAQYCELEQDCEPDAIASVYPVLTSVDADLRETGTLRIKAGLLGQYMICDQKNFRMIVDAFSTQNQLELQKQTLEIPRVIQQTQWNLTAQSPANSAEEIVDVAFLDELPKLRGNAQDFAGRFQTLHYHDGSLCCTTEKWEHSQPVPDGQNPITHVTVEQVSEDGAQLQMDTYLLDTDMQESVVGIVSLGAHQKDPNRPSLILRRMDDGSVWDLAKRSGSTVAEIQKINGLDAEPEPGEILILPVS